MFYILMLVLLMVMEWCYFWIANNYNIIDKPNERSSHTHLTIRGGGIVFPMAMLCFFALSGGAYPLVIAAMLALSAISFADDIRHQSPLFRFFLQFVCAGIMLLQAGYFEYGWLLAALTLIIVVGTINAYNFMDGINGITVGYGAVVLVSLWLVNQRLSYLQPQYFYCLAIGILVFAFFNFRNRALCFAGDVGSVSMAFALVFPTLLLIAATGNLLFVLFFALYGVDTVLTLLHRLYKRENIFTAHRQHLFQYLANEAAIPHLAVTSAYMILQLGINMAIIFAWQNFSTNGQWTFAIATLVMLSVVHTVLKTRIVKKGQVIYQ